jgi:hypothetical protein
MPLYINYFRMTFLQPPFISLTAYHPPTETCLLTQLFNKKPDYNFIRVVGCLCFPYLRPYNKHKLQPRSSPCLFLSYASSHKGCKCMDLSTRQIIISRHVKFHEQHFSFRTLPHSIALVLAESEPSITTTPLLLLSPNNTLSPSPTVPDPTLSPSFSPIPGPTHSPSLPTAPSLRSSPHISLAHSLTPPIESLA